ncbi:MAG: polysaccharide pyruvyl transferase family protein [Sarcina sp.]
MKIGILTFHYSTNYGGILQCFSLFKYLEKEGFDIEIINYVPLYYEKSNDFLHIIREGLLNGKSWNERIQSIKIKLQNNKIANNKFNNFRNKKMKLSRQVNENTIFDVLEKYDGIIVGSDQVWNPSQRTNPEYFLDFDLNFTGKKISYAADSTTEEVKSEEKENLKKCLNEFDMISVRNEHSKKFVFKIVNENVPIVCDPTILYNFEDELIDENTSEEYILAYILGDEIDGGHTKVIEKIKEAHGELPVYLIAISNMNFKINNFADKVYYDLGPEEWLKKIKEAKFIYTDSYHGVLFSIKFKKQFLAYYKEKLRATRFIDLASRYKITNQIITSADELDRCNNLDENIDYMKIHEIVNNHKKDSIKFLNQIKLL